MLQEDIVLRPMLQSYLPDSLIRLQPIPSVNTELTPASDSDDHLFLLGELLVGSDDLVLGDRSLIFALSRLFSSDEGGTSYGPDAPRRLDLFASGVMTFL